jgi:hypothetical protein
MKLRVGAVLLLGSLVAGAGCSSPPPPPPPATTIDVVPEPVVNGSYEGVAWAEGLNKATAIVVPYEEDMHPEEVTTLCNAFNEVFFGPGSPFVQIDQDAMVKAAKRRAVLGSGTPTQADLQRLADQEKADFVVCPRIKFEERPRRDLAAPATASFVARGGCVCSGSPAKGGIRAPDATVVSNEQPSSVRLRDELRSKTVAYMGRLLAKKTLINLTSVKGDMFGFEVNFKGFQADEKSIIFDAIAAAGIKTEEITEGASGQDEFLVKIKSKKNVQVFKQDLEAALTEKSFQFESSRSSNRIEVSKKK